MTMDGSMKNLKILRDIGLDEWFLYSEKYQAFFNWFAQNITDATIYKDSELREYGDLVDDNLVLSGETLAQELIASEAAFADINISKTDLALLEADIQLCTDIEKEFDQLIEDTKKTNKKIIQQSSATNLVRKRLRIAEDTNAHQCLERARDVQDAQLENTHRIKELNRFYAPDQLTPIFIHQMCMHQYYQQCDVFIKYLEQYMQSNFRLQSSAGAEADTSDADDSVGSMSTDNNPESVSQLEIISLKLYKSSVELARQQMKVAAYRHVYRPEWRTDWKLPGGCGGRAAIVAETAELKRLNDEYYAVEMENALDALTYVLRQLASLKVESAAYENTRTKLQRAESRLAQLRDVQAIVADDLMNAEFLWLLMQFDMEKLCNRTLGGVLEAYANEGRAVFRRTEMLRAVSRPVNNGAGSASSLGDWYLGVLQNVLMGQLPLLMVECADGGEPTVFGLYERLVLNVGKSLRCLREPQMHRQIAERLTELAGQEVKWRQFIQDSPASKPILCDLQMKNNLFTIGLTVKEIECRINDFKTNYIKQYTEPMNNNAFVQAKRLLWVWFLTEPKIVLKALKSITAAAKETTTRAPARTVKAISGIIRKNL